jgi:hypothetical protein
MVTRGRLSWDTKVPLGGLCGWSEAERRGMKV